MFLARNNESIGEASPALPIGYRSALEAAAAPTAGAVYVEEQRINVASPAQALAVIRSDLRLGKGFSFFTFNLDHLTKIRRDGAFRRLYEKATYVTADGWPVALLARRTDAAVRRTTGADLVLPACRIAADLGLPVYLFGSTADVLAAAAARLRTDCPGLTIAGEEAPPFGFDPQSEAARDAAIRIAASGARLCLIALGAPKQEQFAIASQAACPNTGFLCIGASLDFLAGRQRRAPEALQQIGMEWAWRLALSPRRLGLRYIRCAALFMKLLLKVGPHHRVWRVQ